MNVVSYFDGMSCGQIALDELDIKVDNYFAFEIDKKAIKEDYEKDKSKINIPKITQFTGKNGIRYYLVENNELPLISVRATIYGGDIFTSDDKIGAAGIAGTVMRSGGTEKYPADKLNEMLENKAASIETSMGL